MKLDGTWYIHDFDSGAGLQAHAQSPELDDTGWMPATVPGDVHSALLALGKIPDPFFSDNVEHVQWVEAREWWFRTRFPPVPAPDSTTRCILTFEGLDLYATVYLNGQAIGTHANMFRPAVFDVTGLLESSRDNVIAVRFDPLRERVPKEILPVQMPEYDSHTRVQVRKAQAQFMWDHTPTCLMVGLWQGVRLDTFTTARLQSPHFRVLSLDPHQAVVGIDCAIERWEPDADLSVEVTLRLLPETALSGAASAATYRAFARVDGDQARSVLVIPEPARWFPNGYGDQALYDMTVTLKHRNTTLDSFHDRVGLRTIEVDRTPDPDEVGCEFFTFVVNGVPIFAKGANWVPTDLLNGRVKPYDYEQWLLLLKEAHGNMLRIWGGGQYEPDAFYHAADRLGILIWHDFMFAGASYPEHRPEFYDEVRKEAEYQVTRLRNRPCLALWCGSNELDWHLDEILWDRPGAYYPGRNIMHGLLPDTVKRLDPDTLYWASSPYGGSDHNSSEVGDKHNWRTWHALVDRRFGEKPKTINDFEDKAAAVSYWHLGTDTGRFISEFGIHGSPVRETFRRNVPPEGLGYNTPQLIFRNRNIIKDRGDLMMQAHTGLPGSLDEYIDFSMMVQAEGLKYGLEHYRRRKFHCSGALFWQWNDNWPSITWSVLDYYRFPKAGYFFVKRAFAPVMLSVRKDSDGQYALWGVNDTLGAVSDTVTWRWARFDGQVREQASLPFSLDANTSTELLRFDSAQFTAAGNDELLWLHSESGCFPDNRWFFAPELRDLKRNRPELQVRWEVVDSRLRARLSADHHAYFVNLFVPIQDTRYSDNWIDIYPGTERWIDIWHPDGRSISPDQIELRWR